MSLKIDDLPAPLRPMMPHRSPSATVKVMFLKSSVAPNETPTLESERRVTRKRKDRAFMAAECSARKLDAVHVRRRRQSPAPYQMQRSLSANASPYGYTPLTDSPVWRTMSDGAD
jgi:hypothetical protein